MLKYIINLMETVVILREKKKTTIQTIYNIKSNSIIRMNLKDLNKIKIKNTIWSLYLI